MACNVFEINYLSISDKSHASNMNSTIDRLKASGTNQTKIGQVVCKKSGNFNYMYTVLNKQLLFTNFLS